MRSWGPDRRLLALVLLSPILGLLGVVAAELVPDDRIATNLARDLEHGVWTVEERTASPLGTTTDHFSECGALTIGLGDPIDSTSVLHRALADPLSRGCEIAADEVRGFAVSGQLAPQGAYPRYWHGYSVITRPAVAVFGVAGVRWIAFAVLAGSVAAMGWSVGRRFGPMAAVLLVGPALLTTDTVIAALSVPQALALGAAWIGGWVTLSRVAARPTWITAALAAALAGVIISYVDLMVATPSSFGLAVAGVGLGALASGERWRPRRLVVLMGAGAAGWFVGMAGMWIAKWVFAAFVLGFGSVVENVRGQIAFRTVGGYDGVDDTAIVGLTKNIHEWWDRPLTPVVIALGLIAVLAAYGRRRAWGSLVGAASCLIILVAPVAAWYVALNNHSQIHAWFAYRAVAVVFGASCALLVVMANVPRTTRPVLMIDRSRERPSPYVVDGA